jgi:hypothetical protein
MKNQSVITLASLISLAKESGYTVRNDTEFEQFRVYPIGSCPKDSDGQTAFFDYHAYDRESRQEAYQMILSYMTSRIGSTSLPEDLPVDRPIRPSDACEPDTLTPVQLDAVTRPYERMYPEAEYDALKVKYDNLQESFYHNADLYNDVNRQYQELQTILNRVYAERDNARNDADAMRTQVQELQKEIRVPANLSQLVASYDRIRQVIKTRVQNPIGDSIEDLEAGKTCLEHEITTILSFLLSESN